MKKLNTFEHVPTTGDRFDDPSQDKLILAQIESAKIFEVLDTELCEQYIKDALLEWTDSMDDE